jgi:hypothetical protein
MNNNPPYNPLSWIACDAHGTPFTNLSGGFTTEFDLPDNRPLALHVRSTAYTWPEDYNYAYADAALRATHGLYVRLPVPPNFPEEGFDSNRFVDLWELQMGTDYHIDDNIVFTGYKFSEYAGPTSYGPHEIDLWIRARGPGRVTVVESLSYRMTTTGNGCGWSGLYGAFDSLQWEVRLLPCDPFPW